MSKSIVIGVDVGGTFTDILALDENTGEVRVAKVPSTRGDQSAGFLGGIKAATDDLGAVSTIIHGTTVATNALLERKGAKAGIITTAGFRDVLEMRRRDRPTTWGLWGQFTPVIERQSRLEVAERTLASGEVATRSIRTRFVRRRRRCWSRGARRSACSSSMAMRMAKTRRALPRSCVMPGQTGMSAWRPRSCLKSASSNVARPRA